MGLYTPSPKDGALLPQMVSVWPTHPHTVGSDPLKLTGKVFLGYLHNAITLWSPVVYIPRGQHSSSIFLHWHWFDVPESTNIKINKNRRCSQQVGCSGLYAINLSGDTFYDSSPLPEALLSGIPLLPHTPTTAATTWPSHLWGKRVEEWDWTVACPVLTIGYGGYWHW